MLEAVRAIMAAELSFGSTGAGVAYGLRSAGFDVHEVDPRTFYSQSRAPVSRLISRATRRFATAAYNAAILDAAEKLDPHVLLTVKGVGILPATMKRLADRGMVLLNYYPDVHFMHGGLDPSTLPLYDMVITTKSFQLKTLAQMLSPGRFAFLPHGYSDLVHFPRYPEVAEEDFVADVTYVGNYSPYKARWLEIVARSFPRVKLRIVGSRWELATPELRGRAIGHTLTGDFYARAIQESRINLAFHSGPVTAEGWEDLVSTRTFEIPACKGFMLHIDNEEIRELFEPGREIDVFESEETLVGKISYYLANPHLRRTMIRQAYSRCVPSYGYAARAQAMVQQISLLLGQREQGLTTRVTPKALANFSVAPS
jgi:spore maturation protein CgeB